MTDRQPTDVTNLDRYGNPALSWSRARDALAASASPNTSFFLGTIRPDGRPHAARVGALWFDGDFYASSLTVAHVRTDAHLPADRCRELF